MYPEEGRTADSAARLFKELCISRPSFWSENMIQATKNLLNEDEQVKFWKWTCDPMNKTGFRDKEVETVQANYDDLNLEGLEFVGEIKGSVPTYKFIKRAKPQSSEADDEKA
jgi:hypothetical protein